MKLGELDERILKMVVGRDVTVGEVVNELAKEGYKKYDVFKSIESLAYEGFVKLVEVPGKFNPYSPTWSKTIRATERGVDVVESKRKAERDGCSVTLVLTHPHPTDTKVNYVSFHEAVELLLSEGEEVVGVVGYVNVNSLAGILGSILQKLRKPTTIRLLCTRVTPDDERVRRNAIESLEAMGVRLDISEGKDEHGRNLHAKFLVSGDLSYVGSHNFLTPALSKNLEVGLLVRDELLAEELRKTFFELGRTYGVSKRGGL